jgi:hypothetical protein
MSGKIKVNSSTWASAQDMYVKTSSTSWASAKAAYVKTTSNTWVQWFRAAIKDGFTRTTTGSLGTADSGQTWNAVNGTWYANGSLAQSDDAATNYSIASINFGVTDVNVSATVSPGTGPAVWVQDANNWYAVIAYQKQVDGTYSCNCACSNCTSCGPSAVYGPSTGGGSYNSTPTASGTTPLVRVSGVTSHFVNGIVSYTCDSGGSVHPEITCCTCFTGGNTIYTNSCTGSSGTGPATCTYPIVAGPIIGYTTVCSSSSGGTYPTCSCGSTCQTCGTLVDAYYVRLLSSVNGTVTTVGTDITLTSAAAAIKVTASGSTITYQAYSDSTMATTLGTAGSYTATSSVTSTNHGIIKAPSAYAQGSTVDNFTVSE